MFEGRRLRGGSSGQVVLAEVGDESERASAVHLQAVYAMSTLLLVLRQLRVLLNMSSIGPLVLMILRMVDDLSKWLVTTSYFLLLTSYSLLLTSFFPASHLSLLTSYILFRRSSCSCSSVSSTPSSSSPTPTPPARARRTAGRCETRAPHLAPSLTLISHLARPSSRSLSCIPEARRASWENQTAQSRGITSNLRLLMQFPSSHQPPRPPLPRQTTIAEPRGTPTSPALSSSGDLMPLREASQGEFYSQRRAAIWIVESRIGHGWNQTLLLWVELSPGNAILPKFLHETSLC